MIKSKIDARERALEIAVEFCKGQTGSDELVVRCAEGFKSFLIGDAELPEVTDDNAHIKELLEIANKSFDNSRKLRNEENNGIFKGGNTGVDVHCVSCDTLEDK